MAQRVSNLPTDPPKARLPAVSKKGFFQTHFGNPEKDEIYGVTDNDYETEPEQIKDEKRSSGQTIWFLGAAALLILLAYGVQRLF
jgi:hypothetical protein